ncbi:uromodulin-like [Lampetra planeri]
MSAGRMNFHIALMAAAFLSVLAVVLLVSEVEAQEGDSEVALLCSPSCKNGGLCKQEDNGTFACQCPEGFMDKDCSNSFLDVICGATKVNAMLRQEFLEQHHVPATSVVLGGLTDESQNNSCVGTLREVQSSARGYYSMSETHGRRNCGAAMESNATHLILHYQVVVGNRTSVIERTYFVIKFSCVYPREERAKADIPMESRLLTFAIPEMQGVLQVLMALYKSDSFTADQQLVGSPMLTAFQRVYVRVHLAMSRDHSPVNVSGYFGLLAVNCWSTPSNNESDHLTHKIINDGCLADQTAYFHRGNGNDTSVDFSFQMFKFIGMEYSYIYIHCAVRVCYTSNRMACVPGCQGGRVKRHSKTDLFEGVLSIGPMKIVDENEDLLRTSINGLPMPVVIPVFVITAIGGALAALCCFTLSRHGWGLGSSENKEVEGGVTPPAPCHEVPSSDPVIAVSPDQRCSTAGLLPEILKGSRRTCVIS